ncbi:MAG: S-methyl-5'-thioinosine phosphorylase [Woeseiaceae bacterium]|nr:S-methyl-5'-thioinosine phosphorylase [Woeseiaceae bacterium]
MQSGNLQYAVIAGSGFQALGGEAKQHPATTEFGEPSGPVRELAFGKRSVLLLGRHGESMLIPPHRINYRANAAALKALGVDCIVALNTVGVITPGQHPGELAIPDQIIDYTFGRDHSIYDGSSATLEHIEFTEPFSAPLRDELDSAARRAGVAVHGGGVYAVMQGPRLETVAEVNRLQRDGANYIGMTAMPEASLAREFGMQYACLSLIVNYAAGRGEKAIHADIEESTAAARTKAMSILDALFADEQG